MRYSIAVLNYASESQRPGDPGTCTLLPQGRLRCDLCPRLCTLSKGQTGFCKVRERQDDGLVLNRHAAPSGFAVDPVEKKPLHHFWPGTAVLSFGSSGCNLACRYCQNWHISKRALPGQFVPPEKIVETALAHGCRSIAYTYNDPVPSWEYVRDTALVARENGLLNIAVTAGYISEKFREPFFGLMDATNIDLKSFSESTHYKLCAARLAPILETLEFVAALPDCWLEITTLQVPGLNDSEKEIRAQCQWIVEHAGRDVPLHFSAFHPDWRMLNTPATTLKELRRTRQIALDTGLHFVYTGNVHDPQGDATNCANCGTRLIQRDWYELADWNVQAGHCPDCGTKLPGHFDKLPGNFEARRIPLAIR